MTARFSRNMHSYMLAYRVHVHTRGSACFRHCIVAIFAICNFESTVPDFIDFFHHPVVFIVICGGLTLYALHALCLILLFVTRSPLFIYRLSLSLYDNNKRFRLCIYFIYGVWCVAAARQILYCHLVVVCCHFSLPLIVMLNVKNGLRFISLIHKYLFPTPLFPFLSLLFTILQT